MILIGVATNYRKRSKGKAERYRINKKDPYKREDARYRSTWHVMKKFFISIASSDNISVSHQCDQ